MMDITDRKQIEATMQQQLGEIEAIYRAAPFDRYVRQSMMVDLEQFIEVPELPEYEREYQQFQIQILTTGECEQENRRTSTREAQWSQ